MKRKTGFLSAFFVTLFLCILILTLSLSGKLKFLSFLEKPTLVVQSFTYNLFQKLPLVSESARVKELKDENLRLVSQVADFERLKKDNAALSDQFQTTYPRSMQLLEAKIIGAPSFVPGVSVPDSFIINKGLKDNLKIGQAVVVEDNLVGVISRVSENLTQVDAINNSSSSITVKTQNGATGIVKGGENLTINNILLSENVGIGEFVFTKGSIDGNGIGVPPDLVIGRIISVEKNPSDLFQKAKIESFVDFVNLSTVFVYLQIK